MCYFRNPIPSTISPLTTRPPLCADHPLSYILLSSNFFNLFNSTDHSKRRLRLSLCLQGPKRTMTLAKQTPMLRISLLVGLSYVSCLVLATGLRAAGDHVTYQCSGKALHSGFPRLDEASIDDLNTLQASGAVTSVDLVQACFPSFPVCFVRR